nr:ABC transporter ATP-binding protein [uncultured Methanoregula sp.]
MALISLTGIQVAFPARSGRIRAVDTIDLSLEEGDRQALIGESGCGKTVLGMAVMGLLPENAQVRGTIQYGNQNLISLSPRKLQQIRGREISLISQNSANALNPVVKIGEQVAEPLLTHKLLSRQAAQDEASRLLGLMGFDDPEQAKNRYPHEFSGGMRERILIAMALSCNPRLIIADEPTAGLDAQVKLQVLELIKKQLADDRTLLLITHDLGAASFLCTRIAVMYAGEIVETGLLQDVLSMPKHPYTQGLIASHPSAGLHPIPGMSPPPDQLPAGCRFFPRCQAATDACRSTHPTLTETSRSHQVRCVHYA